VVFESVDRHTEQGLARWRAAGGPPVPAIEIDGTMTAIMHVSQVARLLDLPAPAIAEPSRIAYDLGLLVGSWERIVRALPAEAVVSPTASRGRSVRNLTMNAVFPISLLPEAHETGIFDWGLVDLDEERAQPFADGPALAEFARGVHDAWSSFVLAHEDTLGTEAAWVETPRGRMRFVDLLSHQRWHLAFHHRQIVDYLASLGRELPDARDLPRRLGVDLPDTVV
jgi:hypothetical protein